jgi:hypothetical protein
VKDGATNVKLFFKVEGNAKFVFNHPSKTNGVEPTRYGLNQFSQQWPVDKFGGVWSKAEAKHWHVNFWNSGFQQQNKQIVYRLTFVDEKDNVVICDPLINNSGPLVQ